MFGFESEVAEFVQFDRYSPRLAIFAPVLVGGRFVNGCGHDIGPIAEHRRYGCGERIVGRADLAGKEPIDQHALPLLELANHKCVHCRFSETAVRLVESDDEVIAVMSAGGSPAQVEDR